MDERNIKRLVIIIAISLIAIFAFKSMMSKTITNMGKVAAEKKQAADALRAQQQAEAAAREAVVVMDASVVSATDTDAATSTSQVASGVVESR